MHVTDCFHIQVQRCGCVASDDCGVLVTEHMAARHEWSLPIDLLGSEEPLLLAGLGCATGCGPISMRTRIVR